MAHTRPDKLVYEIRVALQDVPPHPWRRIHVRSGITLRKLHLVIQHAMGWTNSHLYEFIVGTDRYMPPDPDGEADDPPAMDDRSIRLSDIAAPGMRIIYEYDFGDDWIHDVVLERAFALTELTATPRCVAGEFACPPEDCGGPHGYSEMLKALGDAGHEEHASFKDWLGHPFDAFDFDLAKANVALEKLTD